MYLLLTGYRRECEHSLQQFIINGKIEFPEKAWAGISDSAKDLVLHMLRFDPAERITARESLMHPWITGEAVGTGVPQHTVLDLMRSYNAERRLRKILNVVLACVRLRNKGALYSTYSASSLDDSIDKLVDDMDVLTTSNGHIKTNSQLALNNSGSPSDHHVGRKSFTGRLPASSIREESLSRLAVPKQLTNSSSSSSLKGSRRNSTPSLGSLKPPPATSSMTPPSVSGIRRASAAGLGGSSLHEKGRSGGDKGSLSHLASSANAGKVGSSAMNRKKSTPAK